MLAHIGTLWHLYPMTDIYDIAGTKFDPFEHNLLDNPPFPELTQTGKFRKVRGAGNSDDLIERWFETVEKQAVAIQAEINEIPITLTKNEPVTESVEKAPEMTQETKTLDFYAIAQTVQAEVTETEKGSYVFSKGGRKIAFTAANYTDKDQVIGILARAGISHAV